MLTRLLPLFLALGCTPDLEATDTDTGTPTPDPYPTVEVPWETCSATIGEHACNFKLVDHHDEPYQLYEHYGERAVVIDLSAMWCAPCQMAASEVQAVQDQFGDQIVYTTILIENVSGDDPTDIDAKYWAQVFEIDAPVINSNRDFLIDYPLSSWPTFYYVDQDMVIREIHTGFNAFLLEQAINDML